jgi:uncharacterized protein YcfL
MKYLVAVVCLLLVGCSDSSDDTVTIDPPPVVTEPEVRQATVFDTQLNALDKARQVETTLQDAAEAERLKIEQSAQ